ncbi:MAG: hypothetical protein ABI539_15685 [Acidobacteriota bacterium]
MIKLNPDRRTVRETSASFEYTDDKGVLQTETIRVLYKSPTVADIKRATDLVKAKRKSDTPYWLSEELADQLDSLPDLVDDKGKPFKITEELLSSFSLKNLKAIAEAIEGDLNPKSEGTK